MTPLLRTFTASPLSARLLHAIGKPAVVGLAYHGSTAARLEGLDNVWGKHVDAATFRRHLTLITQNFRVIRLPDLLRHLAEGIPLPRRSVFLSFDDGYIGNYDVAFPILKEFGLSATFFVPTWFAATGAVLWADALDAMLKYTRTPALEVTLAGGPALLPLASPEARLDAAIRLRPLLKNLAFAEQQARLESLARELGFASLDDVPRLGPHTRFCGAAELREMVAGGMDIGSHTHRHQILARVPQPVAREELRLSKAWLEDTLQRDCALFCYPNGHYPADGNDVTNHLVARAGFRAATYMHGGFNTGATDPYCLTRAATCLDDDDRRLMTTLGIAGPRLRALVGRDPAPDALRRRARKTLTTEPTS